MTRLKQFLAAAAALVIGGASVTVALLDSRDVVSPPMTRQEFRARIQEMQNDNVRWYVGIRQDQIAALPEAFDHASGERFLGVRRGAKMCLADWVEEFVCDVPMVFDEMLGGFMCPDPGVNQRSVWRCPSYEYRAEPGQPVAIGANDWRLAEFRGHRYFMRSWELYANQTPNVHFWGTMAEVPAGCLGLTNGSNCRALLRGVNDCWLQDDGRLCRFGFYPAPDANGDPVACTVTATSQWIPCEVLAGQDPTTIATEASPEDLSEQ